MIRKRDIVAASLVAVLLGTNVAWGQVDLPRGNVPFGSQSAPPAIQGATHQANIQAYPMDASKGASGLRRPRLLNAPGSGTRKHFMRTVSSLGIVAGLMLGFIWWTRKNQSDNSIALPSDLVEVVGRVALDAKHKAHLVRFGDRILLLSLDGPGVSKLGEIGVDEFGGALPSDNVRDRQGSTSRTNHRSR